jgi:hypothetical protein
MEKMVREKGEKSNYYVYDDPKSIYYSSISVPELFPPYEARKSNLEPCSGGEKIKIFLFFYIIGKHGIA